MAIDWNMVAAIGQVAGAGATLAAVVVSLMQSSRKPRLKVTVGERLIIPDRDGTTRVMAISVANIGDRVAHVRSVGWFTGWFAAGPSWLKRCAAVQLTGGVGLGYELPFTVEPGQEKSTYCLMSNLTAYGRERVTEPLFTRDHPWRGRVGTRTLAWVSTADGYTVKVRPERSLIDSLQQAEQQALLTTRKNAS